MCETMGRLFGCYIRILGWVAFSEVGYEFCWARSYRNGWVKAVILGGFISGTCRTRQNVSLDMNE